jgi:uncharacterized protein (TIGR02145 family)
VLDGNRIRLRFEGVDAVGRASSGAGGLGVGTLKTAGTVVAVRSVSASVDTLLYSWNGLIRARVEISSLLAGALGPQVIDTSTIPWSRAIGYDSLTYGGQDYKTVTIGTQTWMAENLNVKVDSSWCYGNSTDSCSKYGRLYKWAAVMKLPDSCNRSICAGLVPSKHRGICPTGWHVPSDSEWTTLVNYAGGANTAGKRLKSASGWSYSGVSGNGTDTYGFRALSAGLRYDDGSFNQVGSGTVFSSSSEDDEHYVWIRGLYSGFDDLGRGMSVKENDLSVRCLKDGP